MKTTAISVADMNFSPIHKSVCFHPTGLFYSVLNATRVAAGKIIA